MLMSALVFVPCVLTPFSTSNRRRHRGMRYHFCAGKQLDVAGPEKDFPTGTYPQTPLQAKFKDDEHHGNNGEPGRSFRPPGAKSLTNALFL